MLLTAAIAAPASAGRLGRVPQIDLLRLEGRLGPPRPDDKGTEDLELQVRKDEIHFQLKELTVLSGNRLAGGVLSAVRPYRPNFFVRGPRELLRKLLEADPDATLRILAYNRLGTRDLMLTEIEVVAPATPTKRE